VKDHKRLHGAGIKSLGFIERVFEIASLNPKFAPKYLDVKLLNGKLRELLEVMQLKDSLELFLAEVETAYLVKSNDCYNYALQYYNSLKENAKRGIHEAEEPFKILQPFFKSDKKKPSPSESS
jgi:hypothetical protein